MPLVLNRHKHVRDKWPDTFLIESSGRRETPEQLAEAKLRIQIANKMKATSNKTTNGTGKKDVPDFSSHEEEDEDEEDGNDEDLIKLQ